MERIKANSVCKARKVFYANYIYYNMHVCVRILLYVRTYEYNYYIMHALHELLMHVYTYYYSQPASSAPAERAGRAS